MRWTKIDANQADAPAARYGHIAVVVDTRGDWGTELVILHGGAGKLPSERETFLDDVSVFHVEQEAWVKPEISSTTSPGPRAFHAAAALKKGFVFFGGQALIPNTASRRTFGDVWTLSVNSWAWKQRALTSRTWPSARSLSSLLYIGNEKVLLFGGRNESSKALNDVWILHLAQDRWERVQSTGAAPQPRIKQSMAIVDGTVWLYGGETTTGSLFDDLWTLREIEGTARWQWTCIKAKPRPIGRSGHAFTALPDNLLVCFGGHVANPVYMIFSQSHTCTRELWVLDVLKSRWVKLESVDEPASPIERVCPTLVGLNSGKLFLFGGRGKDSILGDSWWLELGPGEVRTPSTQSLSSLASSALPMRLLGARPTSSENSQETKQLSESSRATSASPFLGTVWSSLPSLTSRGLLSKVASRPTERSNSAHLSTPRSRPDSAKEHEMKILVHPTINGNEAVLRVMEQEGGGLETLFSYYDIDREVAEPSLLAAEPDDHHIDLALISFAESSRNASQHQEMAPHGGHEARVAAGRQSLMQSSAKEFKLGNLWLLLADYKRLLLKSDVLKSRREEQGPAWHQPNARFLHFTMETLRLADLPELLLGYRNLIESP